MRNVSLFVAILGVGLVIGTHVATQRRLASFEDALRRALETRESAVAPHSARAPAPASPGGTIDVPSLLASCRAEYDASLEGDDAPSGGSATPAQNEGDAELQARARIEAEALLARTIDSGTLTTDDMRGLRHALRGLPSEDVLRIRAALADAINQQQVVPQGRRVL